MCYLLFPLHYLSVPASPNPPNTSNYHSIPPVIPLSLCVSISFLLFDVLSLHFLPLSPCIPSHHIFYLNQCAHFPLYQALCFLLLLTGFSPLLFPLLVTLISNQSFHYFHQSFIFSDLLFLFASFHICFFSSPLPSLFSSSRPSIPLHASFSIYSILFKLFCLSVCWLFILAFICINQTVITHIDSLHHLLLSLLCPLPLLSSFHLSIMQSHHLLPPLLSLFDAGCSVEHISSFTSTLHRHHRQLLHSFVLPHWGKTPHPGSPW